MGRRPERDAPPMSPGELIEHARRIAVEAHDGQFRSDGSTPYITHPEAVAGRVGEDPDAVVVAWLHDVIEDSDHSAATLRAAGIPGELVDAVVLLSKEDGDDYDEYLDGVAASPLATRVKIADLLSNLSDNPSPKQMRKYAKGLLRLVPESE